MARISSSTRARILFWRADVSKRADCERVFAQAGADASLPAIKGVFHLAGVVGDGTMATMEWRAFERVLKAKVGSEHIVQRNDAQSLLIQRKYKARRMKSEEGRPITM